MCDKKVISVYDKKGVSGTEGGMYKRVCIKGLWYRGWCARCSRTNYTVK